MTELTLDAGTLIANEETRTATGLLVPFGEVGRTNLGRVKVGAGAIEIPGDLAGIVVNVEHDREQPVGHFLTATETDTGIVATLRFARTPQGDAALADIASGSRKHLSVEATGIRIAQGAITAGRLFAAALVAKPAFPSAALLASDTEDSDDPEPTTRKVTEFEDETGQKWRLIEPDTETPDATASETTEEEEEEDDVTTATAPNTLAAGSTTAPRALTTDRISELLYAKHMGKIGFDDLESELKGQNGDTLFGALADIKFSSTGGLSTTMGVLPQWIGEVWQAVSYKQQVLPLFSHKDLTSLSINGFKWTQKADGGDWAGNKGDVPSNTLTVAPVTGSASPWAVGHDIAREFIDFGVPGFFESYAAAVSESYAKWADTKVATAITAGATALAADALTTLPGPTNGTIGSAASAIIDGATVLVGYGLLPDFALVAPALWKQMVKMPKNNVIGYLNVALGLPEGSMTGFTIRPSSAVAAGKVLVGVKEAATVYELPGAPIRIDALDLARGGIDKAAFGYAGVMINDARGLQLVTAATS